MSLLPPNASQLECALSTVACDAFSPPLDLSSLWDPMRCQSSLLPFLAWSVATPNWNALDNEQQQRSAINKSIELHRKKGTRYAMNFALAELGYPITFKEWFECTPNAAPYTFRVEVNVSKQAFSLKQYHHLLTVINTNKNARSHLTNVCVFSQSNADKCLGLFYQSGSTTFIGPYQSQQLSVQGLSKLSVHLVTQSKTTLTGARF